MIARSRKEQHSLVLKMEALSLIRIEKIDMSWAGQAIKGDKQRLRFRRSSTEEWAAPQPMHQATMGWIGFHLPAASSRPSSVSLLPPSMAFRMGCAMAAKETKDEPVMDPQGPATGEPRPCAGHRPLPPALVKKAQLLPGFAASRSRPSPSLLWAQPPTFFPSLRGKIDSRKLPN
jgi:hypothetical protein